MIRQRRVWARMVLVAVAVISYPSSLGAGAAPLWAVPAQGRDETGQAAQAPAPETSVLVVYYSRSGHTQRMAEAVAEGARRVDGARIVVKSVAEVERQDLVDADGLVLGSPTYYANIAGPMKGFIDDWGLRYRVDLSDKVGGAFATGGGTTGGKEHVVVSLLLAMMNNGMIIAGPLLQRGDTRLGYAGATGLAPASGQTLSDAELDEARRLGERVARVARRVRLD